MAYRREQRVSSLPDVLTSVMGTWAPPFFEGGTVDNCPDLSIDLGSGEFVALSAPYQQDDQSQVGTLKRTVISARKSQELARIRSGGGLQLSRLQTSSEPSAMFVAHLNKARCRSRAMLLESGSCLISLGGARSDFPSHSWPVQLPLSFRDRTVQCPEGCGWKGPEGDLASHQLQCEDIVRISRAVKAAGGLACAQLGLALSWLSGSTRSDLDMSVEHPCGKTVSYNRKQCLGCGAQLDVDNPGAAGQMSFENISWPETPVEGQYTVYVELFRGPKVPFQLVVNSSNAPRLFSHTAGFFDNGLRQVACSFHIGPKGVAFHPQGTSSGLFRRAAHVSVLMQRLKPSEAGRQAETWDCFTDSEGWCRLGEPRMLRVGPPKAPGFESCGAVELDCRELPQE
ncbi:unnamed protein product, partial [Effrenium voratum]